MTVEEIKIIMQLIDEHLVAGDGPGIYGHEDFEKALEAMINAPNVQR